MTNHQELPSGAKAVLVCCLLAVGTILGLTGVDLVLPALPELPNTLGGTPAKAQFVIAAYVAGTAIGLLMFGALAGRFGRRRLLLGAIVSFSALSFAAGAATDLDMLVSLRFFQGIAGSAPAVFAPAIIKQVFSESDAIRAIGALGSVESLVPGLAPVLGVWLMGYVGWNGAFHTTGGLAAVLAVAFILAWRIIPAASGGRTDGRYRHLLSSGSFVRYAFSQAAVLGGLLTFVFGAPVVMVNNLGGTLTDFITMQVIGVSLFIIASNLSFRMVAKIGAERVMWLGSIMCGIGASAILVYALMGGMDVRIVTAFFIIVNVGLGVRGPVGFLYSMKAANGDDDRGAGMTMLFIMAVASGGTAMVAPFIEGGLVPLALGAAAIQVAGLLSFALLPALKEEAEEAA